MLINLSIFHATSSELVRNHNEWFALIVLTSSSLVGIEEFQKSGHPDDTRIAASKQLVNDYLCRYLK